MNWQPLALALITLAVCLRARPIARRLGLMDLPDGRRKIHDRPTPLLGGIAVMPPVLVMLVWLAATEEVGPLLIGLAGVALGFSLIGLADDRRHIKPAVRLGLALVAVLGAVAAVPMLAVDFLKFTWIPLPFFLDWFALPFTLLCVIGLVNAYNMADGKNGLAIGLGLIWSTLIALHLPDPLLPLAETLIAALAVAFVFNLRGQLFLGDAGTYGLGCLFALLAIYLHGVGFDRLPSDRVMLWFLVPVLDCLRLMGWRVLNGRSPFDSDRGHLHHILFDRMRWRYGLAIYLALVAAPAFLAELHPTRARWWVAIAVLSYLACLGLRLLPPAAARARAGDA
ncbi:MAG: undecaprenyl/decaprenyl-phosphate alpha-N-acetylglucosaminyl 1-phosphate transferase [Alphaproteobacteria bacterium]|nr:undecaprenyl/decaprenyl-phosphate alpha-N-acetylglucosaminyl 1-phosphate transferase [Alphaproteobacteria bacterium]